jgi:hypothetical protein
METIDLQPKLLIGLFFLVLIQKAMHIVFELKGFSRQKKAVNILFFLKVLLRNNRRYLLLQDKLVSTPDSSESIRSRWSLVRAQAGPQKKLLFFFQTLFLLKQTKVLIRRIGRFFLFKY